MGTGIPGVWHFWCWLRSQIRLSRLHRSTLLTAAVAAAGATLWARFEMHPYPFLAEREILNRLIPALMLFSTGWGMIVGAMAGRRLMGKLGMRELGLGEKPGRGVAAGALGPPLVELWLVVGAALLVLWLELEPHRRWSDAHQATFYWIGATYLVCQSLFCAALGFVLSLRLGAGPVAGVVAPMLFCLQMWVLLGSHGFESHLHMRGYLNLLMLGDIVGTPIKPIAAGILIWRSGAVLGALPLRESPLHVAGVSRGNRSS